MGHGIQYLCWMATGSVSAAPYLMHCMDRTNKPLVVRSVSVCSFGVHVAPFVYVRAYLTLPLLTFPLAEFFIPYSGWLTDVAGALSCPPDIGIPMYIYIYPACHFLIWKCATKCTDSGFLLYRLPWMRVSYCSLPFSTFLFIYTGTSSPFPFMEVFMYLNIRRMSTYHCNFEELHKL